MSPSFDPKPLKPFFKEVEEQLGIKLVYHTENEKFPIQMASPDGISQSKCDDLLQFIKTQVDLRDNEIGALHRMPNTGKIRLELSLHATQMLAEVYALGFFYDEDDNDEENGNGNTPPKP